MTQPFHTGSLTSDGVRARQVNGSIDEAFSTDDTAGLTVTVLTIVVAVIVMVVLMWYTKRELKRLSTTPTGAETDVSGCPLESQSKPLY